MYLSSSFPSNLSDAPCHRFILLAQAPAFMARIPCDCFLHRVAARRAVFMNVGVWKQQRWSTRSVATSEIWSVLRFVYRAWHIRHKQLLEWAQPLEQSSVWIAQDRQLRPWRAEAIVCGQLVMVMFVGYIAKNTTRYRTLMLTNTRTWRAYLLN